MMCDPLETQIKYSFENRVILHTSWRGFLASLVMRHGLIFEKYFFFQISKFPQPYFCSTFHDANLRFFLQASKHHIHEMLFKLFSL